MALDDFDMEDFLRRMAMHFGGGQQAPAWMTSPHQTVQPGEATSAYAQGHPPDLVGGHPEIHPFEPVMGFADEPQNDGLAQFLTEGHEGGIQGPRMEDIQIRQQSDPHDMQLEGPDDDEETIRRKAALASIGGP